jgi:hypothetical protein
MHLHRSRLLIVRTLSKIFCGTRACERHIRSQNAMSNGEILNFSAFMTSLADCTESAAPADFRQQALLALQEHVAFAAAILGSAAIGAGLAFRAVVVTGLPASHVADVPQPLLIFFVAFAAIRSKMPAVSWALYRL